MIFIKGEGLVEVIKRAKILEMEGCAAVITILGGGLVVVLRRGVGVFEG